MTDLIRTRDALYESTRSVQEVYANSLELLWVEENYGIEVRNQVYEKKLDDYKRYLDIAKKNWDNVEETIENRKRQINKLCVCFRYGYIGRTILDMVTGADTFGRDNCR